MSPFVTLAQARLHLRSDDSADDADLLLKIDAATGSILSYLRPFGSPFQPLEDSNGDTVVDSNGDPVFATDSSGNRIVRAEVQQATLLLVGELYKSREAEQSGEVTSIPYMLPRPVVALLYPLRCPVIA